MFSEWDLLTENPLDSAADSVHSSLRLMVETSKSTTIPVIMSSISQSILRNPLASISIPSYAWKEAYNSANPGTSVYESNIQFIEASWSFTTERALQMITSSLH